MLLYSPCVCFIKLYSSKVTDYYTKPSEHIYNYELIGDSITKEPKWTYYLESKCANVLSINDKSIDNYSENYY